MRKKQHVHGLALGAGALLLAYSFSIATPEHIALSARSMLANAPVGIALGVAPNPINTLAEQLADKEAELMAREERLQYMERLQAESAKDKTAVYSLIASLALFLLVAFNFVLDFKRKRVSVVAPGPYSINLKQ